MSELVLISPPRVAAGFRPVRLFAMLASLAAAGVLAGCETSPLGGSLGRGVAATAAADEGTKDNLQSLSDYIRANPGDGQGYNTRGAAYAATRKPSPISVRPSVLIRAAPLH